MAEPSQLQLRHIGPARFGPYLAAGQGDATAAALHYHWNAQLSAALWIDLGHTEVALRNALNERMQHRHLERGRPGHWLDDPTRELGKAGVPGGRHAQPYLDIQRARERVQRRRERVTPDRIVSETLIGLWHQLVSRRQMFLWPDLAAAFPGAPNRRQDTIGELVTSIRDLGNRIVHRHQLLDLPVAGRHEDLCTLARYLDPELEQWIIEHSTVAGILEQRPGS
ncbi:hypothetical protein [Microlunatus speluncae]|uniref:hypothetical protein n=1 Tax=Microlunatus speluncae TaxID=2594267 RepID=UPI00126649AE|nr:hypothetical protein [Microlunatus speluncae]